MSAIRKIRVFLGSLPPGPRWSKPNGYRALLKICLPLIASTSSASVMLFVDRLFLSRYSLEAIAASLPAGVTMLTIVAFFLGVVSYVSVFSAQYTGARLPYRAAAALWQSLYFCLLAGSLLTLSYFAAPAIFAWSNHPENVQIQEVTYFQVLSLGAIFNLTNVALSSFLAGLGRTQAVMWVTLAGTVLNIPLDYGLIFGFWIGDIQILPEWGIFGAALATVFSWVFISLALAALVFSRNMEKSHHIISARGWDRKLFFRMLACGSPGGLQFFLEVAAFNFFALIVGWLGEFYLAVNNIVFSIEAMSFIPMTGVGMAVSVLVGQAVGRSRPVDGAEATISGIGISSFYLAIMLVCFLVFPEPLLSLFLTDSHAPEMRADITELGTILLRFVVIYAVFDGLYICCFSAIRGAGDVWFPMAAMGFWGLFGLAAPVLLLFHYNSATIYNLWGIMVFYILALTLTGVCRYRSGRWREMRVIEKNRSLPA